LGAAIYIGPAIARNILKNNGNVVYRKYVISLTPDGIQYPTEQNERDEFAIAIENKFDVTMNENDFKDYPDCADFVTPTYECYEDHEVSTSRMPYIDDVKNEDDFDTYYQYVGSHVRVPIGDEIRTGKVFRRKREMYGTVRG
jgi:hypothetical protein